VGRASGYFSQFTEYKKVANDLMCVALMVETKDAVRNIDAICQEMRTGKDVLWIGPFDLSLDMGVPVGSKEHREAIETVERAAARHGIALGGNADSLQQAAQLFSRGYRLFTYGDPPETTLAKSAQRFFKTDVSP
jgi:4-hydroxy-2-oxoheptanedioate aldolase